MKRKVRYLLHGEPLFIVFLLIRSQSPWPVRRVSIWWLCIYMPHCCVGLQQGRAWFQADKHTGCVQNWDQLEVKELLQTSRRSMFSFQDAVAHQRSYGRYENCIWNRLVARNFSDCLSEASIPNAPSLRISKTWSSPDVWVTVYKLIFSVIIG